MTVLATVSTAANVDFTQELRHPNSVQPTSFNYYAFVPEIEAEAKTSSVSRNLKNSVDENQKDGCDISSDQVASGLNCGCQTTILCQPSCACWSNCGCKSVCGCGTLCDLGDAYTLTCEGSCLTLSGWFQAEYSSNKKPISVDKGDLLASNDVIDNIDVRQAYFYLEKETETDGCC